MDEYIKILIPAIIALLGTGLTVFIAFRQWKKQAEVTQRADYLKDKQIIYKELWEKFEDIHIKLRVESVNKSEFQKLVQDTNSFIRKKQLFLEEKDRELANKYLHSIRNFTEIVRSSEDKEAKELMEITAALPISVLERVEKIRNTYTEVEEVRMEINERFRKIIGAN
jgi:hypothetical protein